VAASREIKLKRNEAYNRKQKTNNNGSPFNTPRKTEQAERRGHETHRQVPQANAPQEEGGGGLQQPQGTGERTAEQTPPQPRERRLQHPSGGVAAG